jgi:hypothetical protein
MGAPIARAMAPAADFCRALFREGDTCRNQGGRSVSNPGISIWSSPPWPRAPIGKAASVGGRTQSLAAKGIARGTCSSECMTNWRVRMGHRPRHRPGASRIPRRQIRPFRASPGSRDAKRRPMASCSTLTARSAGAVRTSEGVHGAATALDGCAHPSRRTLAPVETASQASKIGWSTSTRNRPAAFRNFPEQVSSSSRKRSDDPADGH